MWLTQTQRSLKRYILELSSKAEKNLIGSCCKLSPGETIIFDSVSRMSRDAEEGFQLYEQLYRNGINLVFLKEPHINTATYKNAMEQQISLTGGMVDSILKGINEYLIQLAKENRSGLRLNSPKKKFRIYTTGPREGIQTAKLSGKQIGQRLRG